MKTAFCFDLDGTITKQEILPLLAKDLGLQEELEVLTNATISGLLPFSGSFKLRSRLLADIPISRAKAIVRQVELFEKIVSFIQQNKDCCFIVTGNLDVWIADIVAGIGCSAYSSEACYSGDKLVGVAKIIDKGDTIKVIASKGFDRIIAIGDGMGDVEMFRQADVSVFFSENQQPTGTLKELCDYLVFDELSLCKMLSAFL